MTQNFIQYMDQYRDLFQASIDLAKYDAIKLIRDPNNPKFINFDAHIPPGISRIGATFLKSPRSNADWIELYLTLRIAKEGPKIFEPTQMQFEMLEQMRLNINIEDYVQPFPTLIIQLPPAYVKNKRVALPQAGQQLAGEVLPDSHEPVCVIINHNPELHCLNTSVMWDSGLSSKMAMVMQPGMEIEHYLRKLESKEQYAHTLECSQEEVDTQIACLKSALNYCLLLDEIGTKKIGAKNEKHHQRLLERREKHKRDPEELRKISRELRLLPIRYTLDQHVTLYKTVKSHAELPVDHEPGATKSPHHRQGYYKMQPHGPKNSLRKRIRINPTFVNAHLFLGDMLDARATYKG